MKINPHMFRAYDIRGIAGEDLTEEVMYKMGLGTGTYLQKKSGKNIAVGRDNRLSSESFQKAFIKGLLETGCNVTDIGLSTSPLLYFAVCKYGFDGGINITASHNPKEYNGLKIVQKNAKSVCNGDLLKIFDLIQKGEFLKGKGKLDKKDVFEDYIEHIRKTAKISKKLKIVIDAGNGTAGKFAPQLFKELGLDVIPLYCELDGSFPNHEANPEDYKNLEDLIQKVKDEDADLGLAFDGDGDRIGIVDKYGTQYSADYLLLLLSRDLLKRQKGAKIVFDVKCSRILENDIKNNGGEPIMSKTGHSFIEREMKKQGALLAGEVSGHMFFAEDYYGFDDAFLAGVKVVSIFGSSGKKEFRDLFSGIPKTFTTPEIKLPCSDHIKFDVLLDIKNYFCEKYDCITIDGVRVNFDDYSWGLIRCSNTSPNLTLRFEAKDEETLEEIQKLAYSKLKEYKEVNVSYFSRFGYGE